MSRIFTVFADWLNCRATVTSYAVTDPYTMRQGPLDMAGMTASVVGNPGFQQAARQCRLDDCEGVET
ncbi:hypothetical protein HHA04nite_08930 [Halomonas halophila]|uniref:Uncharacterized protein n=1 Tax=Halomonas halophila TaxID=29573 RepID=A0ABQ0U5Q7_9GAMM|nr:hypothetical protein HHA04nite_08930 [Halomonas halophila]